MGFRLHGALTIPGCLYRLLLCVIFLQGSGVSDKCEGHVRTCVYIPYALSDFLIEFTVDLASERE